MLDDKAYDEALALLERSTPRDGRAYAALGRSPRNQPAE
jgi:hypothetical protein